MNNIIKILGAVAALITAIGGLIIALRGGGESTPQPITTIIIQESGDYQNFVENTNLSQYDQHKQQ